MAIFDPTDPSGGLNIDELMRALSPGFFESPATARETGLRQQVQEQDLGLDLMRRLTDIQTGAQERLLGTQAGLQKDLLGFQAESDPLAMLTRGVMGGQSLEGPTLSNLMQILSGRFGGTNLSRLLGTEATGERQKLTLMNDIMSDYQVQLAKLDPDDPTYDRQVKALDAIRDRRLAMLGGAGATTGRLGGLRAREKPAGKATTAAGPMSPEAMLAQFPDLFRQLEAAGIAGQLDQDFTESQRMLEERALQQYIAQALSFAGP